MIEKLTSPNPDAIGFKLSGQLHDDDYKSFVPQVDGAIAAGTNRMLAWFHDFHGWDAGALWEDLKFDATHYRKLERIALVGERPWEKWMAAVCKPFTLAKVRYFEVSEIDKAWSWLGETTE